MHLVDLAKFCPSCGSDEFLKNHENSKKCANCGLEIFKNPSIGAAAVVYDDQDRLMVIKRAKAPAKDTYDFAGGFVDVGETVEEAIIREVKEETNVDVEVVKYLFSIPNTYEYAGIDVCPLDFFFECRIKNMKDVKLQDGEVSDILFLTKKDINPNDFGLMSIREAVKRIIS